ncbi:MAG TPA: hypothetical protein VGX91_06075 [Candidatus Cybelea sp.]|nr:hypothetical protein [Candidatus Cybelea sp.]
MVLRIGTIAGAKLSAGKFAAFTILPLMRKYVARYGAIPVPPPRGMSLEQLETTIAGYRAAALGND